jgi:hypothetical protein
LPLTRLGVRDTGAAVCGIAPVDNSGRIADQAVVTAMAWPGGTRLAITVCNGLVVVAADPNGLFRLAARGRLRLPAVVRHWCGIATGARILLVAARDRGQLRVYPPAALDAMIAAFDAAVLGGDPS